MFFRPLTAGVAPNVPGAQRVAVRNHALIEFSRFSLQPGYIPAIATKTSGRRRLVLRSTTRPCTENTSEDAPSELLAICGWVEVITIKSCTQGIYIANRSGEDSNDQ